MSAKLTDLMYTEKQRFINSARGMPNVWQLKKRLNCLYRLQVTKKVMKLKTRGDSMFYGMGQLPVYDLLRSTFLEQKGFLLIQIGYVD
jgi:hypothetical protein